MGAGHSLSSAVDDFLDSNDRFTTFVMMSFDDEADTSQRLPRERSLTALRCTYDLLAAVLPPAGRRLITRPPEQEDVDAEQTGEAGEPLDFDTYEELARAVFRRIAVDRGRRLLTGVLLGTALVAGLKATLRRTPLVGSLAHALVVPLLPTTFVAGPALGFALCAYTPDHALTRWVSGGKGGKGRRRRQRASGRPPPPASSAGSLDSVKQAGAGHAEPS